LALAVVALCIARLEIELTADALLAGTDRSSTNATPTPSAAIEQVA
jgi:hypothetical protein